MFGTAGGAFHEEDAVFLDELRVWLVAFFAEHEVSAVASNFLVDEGGGELSAEHEARSVDSRWGGKFSLKEFEELFLRSAKDITYLGEVGDNGFVSLDVACYLRYFKAFCLGLDFW